MISKRDQKPFYYFAEGRDAIGAAALAELGIADLFTAPPACRSSSAGPGGPAGVCFAQFPAGAALAELGFWPDRQTWIPYPKTPGLHVGITTAEPPGPELLARRECIAGYYADLESRAGEPERWLVPVGRIFSMVSMESPAGSNFPAALAIGPDGALVQKPLERYAEASRMAERLWGHLAAANGDTAPEAGGEPEEMTDLEEFQAAGLILGLNYRVGPAELGLLQALTTANLSRVLMLFVDLPAFIEHMNAGLAAKKNAAVNGRAPAPPG